jgi:hypothetical protein
MRAVEARLERSPLLPKWDIFITRMLDSDGLAITSMIAPAAVVDH